MHKQALINALPDLTRVQILNALQDRGWISDNTVTWEDLSEHDAANARIKLLKEK